MLLFDNLTYLQMIKITYTILILMVNIFVICLIKFNPDENNNRDLKIYSGLIDITHLKKLSGYLAGALSAYAATISVYSFHTERSIKKDLERAEETIQNMEKEVENSKNINTELRQGIRQKSQSMLETITQSKEISSQIAHLEERSEDLRRKISFTIDPIEKMKLQLELAKNNGAMKVMLEKREALIENLQEKTIDTVDYVNDNTNSTDIINKSSIIDFESIMSFIDSIDVFHRIALFLLIFKGIIISSTISIIFIFYGDFLLKKYNIEARFPKLAKIIELRRKLQRYYLFLAISWILIVSVTEIIFSISILAI